MSANGSENARLATRLASIAEALKPPAKANGGDKAVALSDDEVATLRSKGWSDDEVATLRKARATPKGRELHLLAKGLVGWLQPELAAIEARLAEAVAPLVARNAVCEQRIVELEAHVIELRQAPTMRYEGVWAAERMYAIGDFCTDHGSLWHCNKACTGVRPPESCWTLAVKCGRDAKGR